MVITFTNQHRGFEFRATDIIDHVSSLESSIADTEERPWLANPQMNRLYLYHFRG